MKIYSKSRIIQLFIILLPIQFIFSQTILDKSGWDLQFNDEFNFGENLNDKWYSQYSWGNNFGIAVNNPINMYNNKFTQSNFYIDSGGILHIKNIDHGLNTFTDSLYPGINFRYSSGMLRSKFSEPSCSGIVPTSGFVKGMFEIRAKMPQGLKNYSAFWLTGIGWPPEIDVWEKVPLSQSKIFSTVHWKKRLCDYTSPNCTTSVTIGNGYKSFYIEPGLSISNTAQNRVVLWHDENNYMVGKVMSYNSINGLCWIFVNYNSSSCPVVTKAEGCNDFLGVNLDNCSYKGSGTFNSWYFGGYKSNLECSTVYEKQGITLDQDFHTYTVVWTSTEISWFFDGLEYRTDKQTDRFYNSCGYESMELILNMGANNFNPINDDLATLFSHDLAIDYIRIYKPKSNNTNWSYKKYSKKTNLNNISVLFPSSSNISNNKIDVNDAGNVFYKDNLNRLWNY